MGAQPAEEPIIQPMLLPFAPLELDFGIHDGELDISEGGEVSYGPGMNEHCRFRRWVRHHISDSLLLPGPGPDEDIKVSRRAGEMEDKESPEAKRIRQSQVLRFDSPLFVRFPGGFL